MNDVTKLGETTRAWVANASDIGVRDLDALQKKFRGKLTIQRTTKNGREQVVIYPNGTGDRSEFDSFMETNGAFTKQTIDVTRL